MDQIQFPSNMTEEEVLDTIDYVVNTLSRKFVFGYFDIDDLKQEGRIEALKALKNYDESCPLAPFLFTHLRLRYLNFIRKEYFRHETPCKSCIFYPGGDGCNAFEDRDECEKWTGWKRRNEAKKNLASPINIDSVCMDSEDNMSISTLSPENKELLEIIDQEIPSDLRADYIRLKNGCKLSAKKIDNLKQVLKDILDEQN